MSSHEDLFETSILEVIAPPPSLEFPADYTGEEAAAWIARMRDLSTDRKAAFFDENLDFFLTIRFPSPSDQDPPSGSTPQPPHHLLTFLAHLQISYETSYISPSSSAPDNPGHSRLSMPPPRNSSMQRNRPGNLLAGNASMFPPHTPHPIPSAAESDLKYVQSQGTPLVSAVWGESENRDKEAFTLLWDAAERSWLAVYKMTVLVLFMVTKVPDPLLCITVSTTLRHKPLPVSAPRKTLAALIDAAGGLKSSNDLMSARVNGATDEHTSESDDDELLSGLQEVNLLEGLANGPTFNDSSKRLSLPSTRLGSNTRMHEFALGPPPSAATTETPIAYSSGITSPPPTGNLPRAATLRKSFRKTMKTHMGFRVRMRTVFVPYFLLPQGSHNGKILRPRQTDPGASDSDSDLDEDILEEREQREAGNEEHTVVLSVEVENLFTGSSSTTSGSLSYHFEVERVDVSISGTGATASFIGWGRDEPDVFPLDVGPREQVNLLYAVSFLRGPEVDEFSLARPAGVDKRGIADELQRAVTIHLIVRPFEPNDGNPSYTTNVFPSRWNCVLDLASSSITRQQKRESAELEDDENQQYFVLPTPASPFPSAPLAPPTRTLTPLTTRSIIPLTAVAGSKRHTIAALETPVHEYARMPKSPMNYQSSTSMLNPNNQPPSAPLLSSPTPTGQTLNIPNRASYIPPSVAFQASFPRSPTTFDPPTSPPLPMPPMNPLAGFTQHSQTDSASTINEFLDPPTPRTPAYPAYPNSPAPIPPTPFWQTPIAQQSGPGTVGPSVEIRRERGGSLPQTPGPTVGGFGAFTGMDPMKVLKQQQEQAPDSTGYDVGGEPIVVSVGLLPAPHHRGGKKARGHAAGELYPLDQFTLDIFVFNQSSWTRRFEVSYPDERRRRRKAKKEREAGGKGEVRPPGIIPLENRVRIGPLLPSTCQSVRMDFLALAPGVHSIDVLTLTDIQSGLTMHLRNVIDIIVREPEL
ncbi:TRAPP trafficking subunit Trs65-domain-containing protein [Cerioporus squamosus]|nr:TRAPP trafficking subunit Trs65-domain-containing protein [Cerioporus squamosus]